LTPPRFVNDLLSIESPMFEMVLPNYMFCKSTKQHNASLERLYCIQPWKKTNNFILKLNSIECHSYVKLQTTSTKRPKHSSLDYLWFCTKTICKISHLCTQFQSIFTQYLNHIVHQTKLLNIIRNNFSKYEWKFNS
jgi:hypothetical protein